MTRNRLLLSVKHMTELKRIQAVSFDAGGTLIEPCPSVGEIYAEMAGRFGMKDLSADWLNRQFAAVWKAKGDFDYSTEAWYGVIRHTFAERAVELPSGFYPALYERFTDPGVWHVFEDVRPTLDVLASQGIPLAVVSNWDPRLRPLLKDLRLAGYFDTIVPSCEIAFHKPSEVIFQVLVRRLGLPAEEILHVGDHYREDVEGARSAGLQALQLARQADGQWPDRIRSLLELPALIEAASGHHHLRATYSPVADYRPVVGS